jgi:hypothetical protein
MESLNGHGWPAPALGAMPAFLVEVDGTWRDPHDGATSDHSRSFLVMAPGAAAAETAAQQLFAAAARGERCQTVEGCATKIRPGT